MPTVTTTVRKVGKEMVICINCKEKTKILMDVYENGSVQCPECNAVFKMTPVLKQEPVPAPSLWQD